MRLVTTAALLFISTIAFCQNNAKGYGQIGITTFINEKFSNRAGVSMAGGVGIGNISSAGAGFDIYILQKNKSQFVNAYGDFRFYIKGIKKSATPFVAVQPGWILYNKKVGMITSTGQFAFNALAGFTAKGPKAPGLIFMVGMSLITFKTSGTPDLNKYTGLKITAAVRF